jgi:hypothetical protein
MDARLTNIFLGIAAGHDPKRYRKSIVHLTALGLTTDAGEITEAGRAWLKAREERIAAMTFEPARVEQPARPRARFVEVGGFLQKVWE